VDAFGLTDSKGGVAEPAITNRMTATRVGTTAPRIHAASRESTRWIWLDQPNRPSADTAGFTFQACFALQQLFWLLNRV
jgi:hypothetical protein